MAEYWIDNNQSIHQFIQNTAVDGDIIRLYGKTYSENNIHLTKKIQIIGSGKGQTIIDAHDGSTFNNPGGGTYKTCFYRNNNEQMLGTDWHQIRITDSTIKHNIDQGYWGGFACNLMGLDLHRVVISGIGLMGAPGGERPNIQIGFGAAPLQAQNRFFDVVDCEFYNPASINISLMQIIDAIFTRCLLDGAKYVSAFNMELHYPEDVGLLAGIEVKNCTIRNSGVGNMKLQGYINNINVHDNYFAPNNYEGVKIQTGYGGGVVNSQFLRNEFVNTNYMVSTAGSPNTSTIWFKENLLVGTTKPYWNYVEKEGEWYMKTGIHTWTQSQTQSSTRVDVYIPKSEFPQTPQGAIAALRYGGEAHYFVATFDPRLVKLY